MTSKKNEPTRYTPDMSEQDNKESIIRMTEQIKALSDRVDGFIEEVRRGFADIKTDARAIEDRYATKEELHELKKSHQSLVKSLMSIVIAIVLMVIAGVMALLGFNK